jgi:hypothetical protein
MQLSVLEHPSTRERYGVDGNSDGRSSPYEPPDAIPAAARCLRDSGAPADNHPALFAYNHADWYRAEVLAEGATYRGAKVASRCRNSRPSSVRSSATPASSSPHSSAATSAAASSTPASSLPSRRSPAGTRSS